MNNIQCSKLIIKVVVLDAMGVIYSVGDDVKDLLYPFIREKGGIEDTDRVNELYISASLGNISSAEFWKSVGISHDLEDEYLQRHKLTNGLLEFLQVLTSRKVEVWCLSNDLSEWSKKLRTRFGLEKHFKGFVISGDVGFRKADPAIFNCLLGRINTNAKDVVFVDDNPKNLDAAAKFGFKTVLFDIACENSNSSHEAVSNFSKLQQSIGVNP